MSRRRAGYKSKRNGQRFEELIELSCNMYKRENKAFIQKTPENTRFLRPLKGGKFVAVHDKKSQPDFKGLLKGGQAVVFEAKHTDGTNIRFDRLQIHQKKHLVACKQLGAEAFLLISFDITSKDKRVYKVPIKDWLLLENKLDKKSVNEDDLKNYRVLVQNDMIRFL